jgi:hypothetical protein
MICAWYIKTASNVLTSQNQTVAKFPFKLIRFFSTPSYAKKCSFLADSQFRLIVFSDCKWKAVSLFATTVSTD